MSTRILYDITISGFYAVRLNISQTVKSIAVSLTNGTASHFSKLHAAISQVWKPRCKTTRDTCRENNDRDGRRLLSRVLSARVRLRTKNALSAFIAR